MNRFEKLDALLEKEEIAFADSVPMKDYTHAEVIYPKAVPVQMHQQDDELEIELTGVSARLLRLS